MSEETAAHKPDESNKASLPESRHSFLNTLKKAFSLREGETLRVTASAPTEKGVVALCVVSDNDSAGRFLVLVPRTGAAQVLAADPELDKLEEVGIPKAAAQLLRKHLAGIDEARTAALAAVHSLGAEEAAAHSMAAVPPHPPQNQDEVNAAIYNMAIAQVNNLSSADAPDTDGGNLACAWAVNRIVEMAIGHEVGGGLSTIAMHEALVNGSGTEVEDGEVAPPGSIIISPSEGSKHGHVGILGQGDLIYSNSSGDALWEQNYTLERWEQHYKNGMGLDVLRYTVNL